MAFLHSEERLFLLMEDENMNNRMTSLEFICWSVFLGGVLFFLDVWLTRLYEENTASITKQIPVQMEMKK